MAFNSYEELMAAVEDRRKAILTLEVDLGGAFSPEHEDAKKELMQAKMMRTVVGGSFLGGDNLSELEQRVADTRPDPNVIYIQFEKLELDEWRSIITTAGLSAVDQYEKVLGKTFIGLYGSDPVKPEDFDPEEVWVKPEPLTTDPLSVSSRGGAKAVLPGGALNSVVQNFMVWQNSGGDVSIRPTKSGRD